MSRIVVITGGSSGIGKACVEEFRKNNDIVYSLSRNEIEGGFSFSCDVTDESQVKEALSKIGEREGRIDVLINNAGFGISGAIEFSNMDEVKQMFNVNVFGVMNVAKHALPLMNKGTKIINMSSTCGLFPVPFRSVYSATKSAVNMISYGLNMELKKSGVQVTAICPGEIKTNFSKNRKVNLQTSDRYGDRIERAGKRIEKNYDKRMDPNVFAKKIYKISNKKRIKPMIIIGNKFKLLHFSTRFISTGLFLKVNEKYMGGHK